MGLSIFNGIFSYISGYYSDWKWEKCGNMLWNTIGPTQQCYGFEYCYALQARVVGYKDSLKSIVAIIFFLQ